MLRGLGWIPDLPDHRDRVLRIPARKKKFPRVFSRRSEMPPIKNQSTLGSCTGFGTARNIWWAALREKGELLADESPSELMLYYGGRWYEKTTQYDSGAQIRDVIKFAANHGVVGEHYWPYDIQKFNEQPPAAVYRRAKKELIKQYARVEQDLDTIRTVLLQNGPIVFGFTCFESLGSDRVEKTGLIPMPKPNEGVEGGHCVCMIGFDDDRRLFEFDNSWGAEWGDQGRGWLPYDYVLNPDLADDFWNIAFA